MTNTREDPDREEMVALLIADEKKLTPELQIDFLIHLAKTGNVSEAAAHIGVNRLLVYRAYRRDPEFAEAWRVALDVACDSLETEVRRRAVDGWNEPVFYRGEEVGSVRKYSDTLLLRLLEAHRPKRWRTASKVEVTTPLPEGSSIQLSWGEELPSLSAPQSFIEGEEAETEEEDQD